MARLQCTALLLCFAYSVAAETVPGEGTAVAPASEDVARRELTDSGYVIRYNNALYNYPLRAAPVFVRGQKNPTETNVIGTEEEEEDRRRPLFYFTTYELGEGRGRGREGEGGNLPTSGPYVEVRKKREVLEEESVPESSKVGKLRRKRTYCGKCGRGHGGYKGYGGYGVSYVPVTYAVYPVYVGGGGGGKGCNTCGGGGYNKGGYGGYGGYGGGGGSFSFSSSSAQSSAGSFGWGK